MNVVVLGDGLLGSEIVSQTSWNYISRKKNKFDITKPDDFEKYFIETFEGMASKVKYDTIINCIANTNTYSENKEEHWKVNYEATANLVDFCNKWNIKLIHISTDYVYTNSVNNASENDVPVHGNNWYSYTKVLADAYIELKSKNYLICRETHKPKPFPYEKAWVDQVGNFDYVDVIANIIIKLTKGNFTGMYNVGTELKSIAELASQTREITPMCKTSWIPSNTSMNLSKLKDDLKRLNQ